LHLSALTFSHCAGGPRYGVELPNS
jgi:hypothetical protein